jgi:hypothetical protein
MILEAYVEGNKRSLKENYLRVIKQRCKMFKRQPFNLMKRIKKSS